MADHQAFAHHRCQNGYPAARPGFERLTREGVNFTRAYSVCPLCTPARASMLTGVYPHRHGMTANAGRFGARAEFEPDQRLISHYLADAGFRCGYFGKWHCGEQRIAADYGFEGFSLPGYGYPYRSEAYARYLAERGLPLPTVRLEDLGDEFGQAGERLPVNRGNWFDAEAGSAVLEGPLETHEAFFVSYLAAQWLRQRVLEPEPFFLRVDVWGPHAPYVVAPPFADTVSPEEIPRCPNFDSDLTHRPDHHRNYRRYWRDTLNFEWPQWRRQLARCFEHGALVDAAFNRILEALDQMSLARNTVVICTADHGDALATNGGVANKGAMMVEEVSRIPLAIRFPGNPHPGAQCPALVSNMDLAPTVLALAGAAMPSPLDGRSLLPLMQDPLMRDPLMQDPLGSGWPASLMTEHYGLHKLQFQRMLRWQNLKYVIQADGFEELYDLTSDPYELDNLAISADRVKSLPGMRQKLIAQMEVSGDDSANARMLIDRIRTG